MCAALRVFAILCLMTALWSGAARAEVSPRIAVLELKGSLKRGQLGVMSDKVRAGVLRAIEGRNYIVMSRENMAVLLRDMGLDCESAEGVCEVETGRNIGAAFVVSGSVEDVGDGLWLCTLKVHATNTGALLATGDVRGTKVLDLIDQLPPMMHQLMLQSFGERRVDVGIGTGGNRGGSGDRFGFTGAVNLDVQAKLKKQACDREAQQEAAQLRSGRLQAAVDQAQAQASRAWQARVGELEMCAKLARSDRSDCIAALDRWLDAARSMTVEITASVETVRTDCGSVQHAVEGERRTVAAQDVPAAEALLERLKASGSQWKQLHQRRFSTQARSGFERKRARMVQVDLRDKQIRDQGVLEAMAAVPMELFVPTTAPSQYLAMVYRDGPVPIGYDESISQPWLTAYTLEFLRIQPGDRVLELKSASGYQTAVLAQMGAEVWSVETDRSLAAQVGPVLEAFRFPNLQYKVGSVQTGWTGRSYKAIIATAAYRRRPTDILRLLAPGGRMVAPIGPPGGVQHVVLYTKSSSGRIEERQLMRVNFSMMPGE